MVGHTPADDTSRVGVDDHRQVQEALPGREIGDVGAPERVWLAGGELALHEVVAELGLFVASGRAHPSMPTHATQVRTAHQARHSLATTVHAVFIAELGVDPRDAIRAATARMDLLDPGGELRVGD